MTPLHDLLFRSFLIGAGATAVLDLWSATRLRLFRVPFPNYPMVGRWIGHFPAGRFAHADIARSSAVVGEGVIGWAAHYAIGILYAAVLLAIRGPEWAQHPTPVPALVFGLLTVAAPFLLMQPGMGQGLAASRTPNPGLARIRSILAHLVFGFGLYASALLLAAWAVPS
jgi:hypothetical protein